jgi:hypothetical protein
MLNLLLVYNFPFLIRRLYAGFLTVLLGFALSGCGPQDDAGTLAAECVRSASTLAPIMGGQGSVPCAAAPAALAQAMSRRTLVASAR